MEYFVRSLSDRHYKSSQFWASPLLKNIHRRRTQEFPAKILDEFIVSITSVEYSIFPILVLPSSRQCQINSAKRTLFNKEHSNFVILHVSSSE
jgi:hypothetical protein